MAKSKKDSSWKLFEKLASDIEKELSPNEAIVKCPDRLPDVDTGQLREVDASIKYKVGTIDVLIILECRLRKNKQSTMWIEQLASKRESVGAAKCVAISSNGFSKPAIRKAKKLGIELRILRNMGEEAIKKMAPISTCHYLFSLDRVNFSFYETIKDNNLELDDKLNYSIWTKKKTSIKDKIINYESIRGYVCAGEYIEDLIRFYYSQDNNDTRFHPVVGKDYIFSFNGISSGSINTNSQNWVLGGATFVINFSQFIDCSVSLKSGSIYSNQNRNLATQLELEISGNGKNKLHKIICDFQEPNEGHRALSELVNNCFDFGFYGCLEICRKIGQKSHECIYQWDNFQKHHKP